MNHQSILLFSWPFSYGQHIEKEEAEIAVEEENLLYEFSGPFAGDGIGVGAQGHGAR